MYKHTYITQRNAGTYNAHAHSCTNTQLCINITCMRTQLIISVTECAEPTNFQQQWCAYRLRPDLGCVVYTASSCTTNIRGTTLENSNAGIDVDKGSASGDAGDGLRYRR